MGTELGGAGSRRKNGILGRSSVTPVVRSIVGGAPRTVCGASCRWRHASHTLHGEGSGGLGRGLGGGGALMKHVSFGLDAWQAVRSSSGLWGREHVAAEGRPPRPLRRPCFSSSSSWALLGAER